MINCVVIEKDVSTANTLTEHIHLMNDVHLLGWYTTMEEGLEFCRQHKVDLILIDADDYTGEGIGWVKEFTPLAAIVITASSPDHALAAFEAGVVDYMIKPVSFARLFFALEKVRRIYFTTVNPLPAATPGSATTGGDHLFIKSGNRVVRVKIADILYVEGLKSYVAFHLRKEKILSLMTMKEVETKLKPYQFLRIHKSYIINLQHINYIEKGMVLLSDAGALPIGETYKNAIQESFK